MGFLTIVSNISSFIDIANTVINNFGPKLQEEMKNFAQRLLVLSEKYPSLEDFAKILDKASDILGDVLFALGINTESAEIIGFKASKSEKGMEDFSSVEDYIKHLNEEIDFDKEEFDSLNPEEQKGYTITGLAIEAGAISEKLGIEIPAELVEFASKLSNILTFVVEADKIISIINKSKDNGINNLNDIVDFFNGTGSSDRLKTSSILQKILEEEYPNKANDIINDITDKIRE